MYLELPYFSVKKESSFILENNKLKMRSFSIFLFFFFFKYEIQSKFISAEFTNRLSAYHMPIYFGTPPKKLNLDIDMAIDYTWTTSFLYPQNSKTQQFHPSEDILSFSNKRTIQPDRVTDKAQIVNLDSNNNITIDFLFYYLKYKMSLDYEAIGLAYKFHDQSLSLIHNLYTNDYIDKLAFGFVTENDRGGLIFFGGLPENVTENKIMTKFKVDDRKNTWGLKLSRVGNYINSAYAYLNCGLELILAPYDFFNYLENDYLKDYLDNKTCSREIDQSIIDYKRVYYRCNCENIKFFPSINFIFDGKTFELKNSELFDDSYNSCDFAIQHKTSNPDEWVFGAHFIKNYITLFDYEDNSISFFTKEPLKKEYYYQLTLSIKLVIIAMIGTTFLLVGMKMKEENKNKKVYYIDL